MTKEGNERRATYITLRTCALALERGATYMLYLHELALLT